MYYFICALNHGITWNKCINRSTNSLLYGDWSSTVADTFAHFGREDSDSRIILGRQGGGGRGCHPPARRDGIDCDRPEAAKAATLAT